MISDVPNGFEAHKLINISLGKIAASRSGRTGASLHKSLLVASVLHKARYVYLEEAHHYHHTIFCPPQGQPEEFVPDPPRAPTPLPEVTVTPVMPQDSAQSYQSEYDNDGNTDNDDDNNDDNNNEYPPSDDISEECKSRLSGECDGESSDLETLCYSRKRRRVSDQETEAAISSILPKRLKAENFETDSECNGCFYSTETAFKYETKILCSCGYELSSCQCADQPSTEENEVCNMEVDHITSLVSIFSFNQQQQQQQSQQQSTSATSDLCSKQAHHQSEAVGPPVLALTA